MTRARPFLLTAAFFFLALVSTAATGVFREQVIPGPPGGATEVVAGRDGGFWFTQFDANRIGVLSPDGRFREFNVPSPDSGPRGITSGSGVIWFTEFKAGKIGKLTADGVFTEYVIPTPRSGPWGIAWIEGSVWFTESATNRIGRLSPDGTITEFVIPTADSAPRGIASGPNSLTCFTEFAANQIACLDRSGRILERLLPTQDSGPEAIAASTNQGNLWFVESQTNRIAVLRFGLTGTRTFAEALFEEFAIPTPASGPSGIAADFIEGSAWFTERSAGQIGFISSDGRMSEYPLADRASQPTGIILDAENWFLESAGNRLVAMQPDAVLVAGAGNSDGWTTEFQVANLSSRPSMIYAGTFPRPAYICLGQCFAQGFLDLPANGSGKIKSNGISGIFVQDLRPFLVRTLEEGDLPSVKARIYKYDAPSQSADLPTIRLSTLTALNPRTLSFPGAVRNGSAHSNLLISEVNTAQILEGPAQLIRVRVDLLSSDGSPIASGEFSVFVGTSLYLVDVIGRLGVTTFHEGQIRVSKVGDQGLIWGYLATVDSDGAISIFSGLNP